MERPALEVADIFRDFGPAWRDANRGHVSHAQLKVMNAMESQSKQRDSHLARLSFIWPRSAMFRTATFDIKVDGQVVGKIAPDSYFFVDRQASTYTLKVEPPFDWIYFETQAQVTSGGTYYYAINVILAYAPITGGRVVAKIQKAPLV